jgi:hypothetical protein
LAQKIGKPANTGRKPAGPKIGKAAPRPAPVEASAPVPKTIVVQPSEGYLALSTTPAARITLTAGGGKRSFLANAEGQLHVPKLKPGSYQIEIKHDDCQPHTESLKIVKGEPTVLFKPLIEKYGLVMLGLGALVAPDVAVKLDGQPVAPAQLQMEKEMIGLRRVPVGAHRIEISKPGYIDWSREKFEVKPGDAPDNLIPIDLERATIAVTIRSLPGARVYVDNEERGVVAADQILRVPGLPPGPHKLRLELFGYENAERPLALTLDRREMTEEVKLESLIEIAEDKEDFDASLGKWFPARPAQWQLENGRGMLVRGDAVALFKRASYPANRFNLYDDFTLVFRARFATGKGAAWIARARDARNYYRFELTTTRSAKAAKLFIASLCRDDRCTELSRDPVVVNIEEPNDTITIKLEARGAQLEHYISAVKDPRTGMQPLGRVISDELFQKGGVGLCAVNELETYVSNFLVIPTPKQGR